MDVLISVALGTAVLLALVVVVLTSLGVGDQFLDPVVGFLGKPVIRLSRRLDAARRQRAIKKLPPGIPPPPPAP